MKHLVKWRLEGETLIEADDKDAALDKCSEYLGETELTTDTQRAEVEMLSCELVDWGSK